MDFLADNWMPEPGEFLAPGQQRAGDTFYRNSYILIAALRLGRFDIASPAALEHYFRYQHKSGGFCASLDPAEQQRIDPLFTAVGGWVSLYTACLRRAVQAGDFLVGLIDGQPEMPERFYFQTDTRTGQCVTDVPEGETVMYFADRQKTRQHFFYAGALMGFLSDLYRATADQRYLDAAVRMFEFEQGMPPESFAWPSKCKVGWGAALLYSVTKDPAHRAMAEHVADVTFLAAQRDDGSWPVLNFLIRDDGTGVPLPEVEVTAEFSFEFQEMVKAMG
jgi:hypothetical protein